MNQIVIIEDGIQKHAIESKNYIIIALENDDVIRIHDLDASFVNMTSIFSSLLEATAVFSKAIKESFWEEDDGNDHEVIQTDPGHWKQ